jgi:hypothetical protein
MPLIRRRSHLVETKQPSRSRIADILKEDAPEKLTEHGRSCGAGAQIPLFCGLSIAEPP